MPTAAESIPTTMPAAVFRGPRQLAVEQRPVPTPGPEEALVEVGHCGVCGTDLHFVLDGWATPGSVGGHEFAGRIAAVGDDVSAWKVGDLVAGGPRAGCGTCAGCRAERPSLCARRDEPGVGPTDGAFAGYVLVHHDRLIAVPSGLDPRTAALAEPLAVALHALTRSGVQPHHRALVSGAGPIGALVIAALRSRGVQSIEVSEPSAARRALAERVGASRTVTPDALTVPSIAEPGLVVDDAVDVAFECSGRADAMEAALAQLVRGGTLVLVGSGIRPPRFDPNRILLNELVVTGSFEYDANGVADALELLASGRLPTGHLVEPADVELSGLLEAMERLATGELAGKVLVAPTPNARERDGD